MKFISTQNGNNDSNDHNGQQPRRQIIVLGAGMDSAYFDLCQILPRSAVNFSFVEIDLHPVVAQKVAAILTDPQLSNLALGSNPPALLSPQTLSSEAEIFLHLQHPCQSYSLISADLSSPTVLSGLRGALEKIGVDLAAPTIFVSECVLAYLTPHEADAALASLASSFTHNQSHFLLHEQLVHPKDDPFGDQLERFFSSSGAPLLSLQCHPTLASQVNRFLALGYAHVEGLSALDYFERVLPGDVQRHIELLEPFDEFEDWFLTASHYFFLVASKCQPPAPLMNQDSSFCFTQTQQTSPEQSPLGEPTIPVKLIAKEGPKVPLTVEEASQPGKQQKKKKNSPQLPTEAFTKVFRRWGHTAIPIDDTMVLVYAGMNDGARLGDTWLCDLSTKEANPIRWQGDDPGKRTYHGCVSVGNRQALVFGGRTGPSRPFNDHLVLDLKSSQSTKITATGDLPSPRWRHKMCVINRTVFLCGGTNGTEVFGDVFALDLEAYVWKRIGSLPPTFSHSLVAIGNTLVVHGGLTSERRPHSATYLFNTETATFTTVPPTPKPLPSRFSHEMVSSSINAEVVMILGGVIDRGSGNSQDTFVQLNIRDGTWSSLPLFFDGIRTPLMVGHATFRTQGKGKGEGEGQGEGGQVAVLGGGSSVFSLSACFNDAPLLFDCK